MAMASVSQLGALGINAVEAQYLFLWVAEFEEQLACFGCQKCEMCADPPCIF